VGLDSDELPGGMIYQGDTREHRVTRRKHSVVLRAFRAPVV